MSWQTILGSSVVAAVVSGIIAILGRWLVDRRLAEHQAEMSKTIEGVKTQGGKDLWVHQLQFKKEFNVYKELWLAAFEFHQVAIGFRQIRFDDGVGEEERKKQFATSHDTFKDIVFANKPFYAKEVHDSALEMIKVAHDIVSCWRKMARLEERQERDYSDEDAVEGLVEADAKVEKGLDALCKNMDQLAEQIRSRIVPVSG
jgi:hypothetical protein